MSKFSELINSDQPVLVDFYADWCGPCKMMTPILQELSGKIEGKARIIKVDVDKNPQAAQAYGIQSIPTMIIFKNGQIKWRHSGAMAGNNLEKVLEQHL